MIEENEADVSPRVALAARVSCPVYDAGDEEYADEIAPFNRAIVHTPDLVVGAESAGDVVQAVQFAREQGLRVTVQSTGHGAEAPVTDGLMITTRRLDTVGVEPESRIASIGAGARWDMVIAAGSVHGLAPITGSSTGVGVVGYLLGGGLGPLARSHGFSSDYLLGLTVVTGTGDLVDASPEENPDLFWALRGGKSGLGIVTQVRFRLVELRTLYAGSLFFEEEHVEQALRVWANWLPEAHPRVTTSIGIVKFPPFEAVPEPFRGRRLMALRFAYPGPSEEGALLAAPLRAAAPVYIDDLAEMPAAQVARIHNDPTVPAPTWVTGALLTDVNQDVVTKLVERFGPDTDSPFIAAEIRHMGGATRQDVEGGSAVGGRGGSFTFGLVGANPALFHLLPAAADETFAALRPWVSAEANVNFMGPARSAEHLATAWPRATLARLNEIRQRYDPDGVFARSPMTR